MRDAIDELVIHDEHEEAASLSVIPDTEPGLKYGLWNPMAVPVMFTFDHVSSVGAKMPDLIRLHALLERIIAEAGPQPIRMDFPTDGDDR